jgi:YhcH/YjgK/YiaL family protein
VRNNLLFVYKYFKQALNPSSSTHKYIFTLPIGAFEKRVLSSEIFALEQHFFTKDRSECFIESHEKYVDFQLILDGEEYMEYIDKNKLTIKQAYDQEKDLIIYDLVDSTSKFLLEKGDLAIFFPQDAHMGQPYFQITSKVYKTVVKVPISLLNV